MYISSRTSRFWCVEYRVFVIRETRIHCWDRNWCLWVQTGFLKRFFQASDLLLLNFARNEKFQRVRQVFGFRYAREFNDVVHVSKQGSKWSRTQPVYYFERRNRLHYNPFSDEFAPSLYGLLGRHSSQIGKYKITWIKSNCTFFDGVIRDDWGFKRGLNININSAN